MNSQHIKIYGITILVSIIVLIGFIYAPTPVSSEIQIDGVWYKKICIDGGWYIEGYQRLARHHDNTPCITNQN